MSIRTLTVVTALFLSGCIKPGQYVDANGNELRNNCPIQSVCLDVPCNRPGASCSYSYFVWHR